MDEEKKSLIIEIVADNKYPHVPISHLELVGKICQALEGVNASVRILNVISKSAHYILETLEDELKDGD